MALTDGSPQSIFQLVLLAVFAALAVAGVIFLAVFKSGSSAVNMEPVTIWGPTFAGSSLRQTLYDQAQDDPRFEKITYVEKNPYTLYGEIVEAISIGRAPDLVVIDQTTLLALRNKLYPIAYEQYPLAKFRGTFVEGAEVFVGPTGIYGLPFAVDPLVMFWNRDLFASAAIAKVPEDWDTFIQTVTRLNRIEGETDVTQSGVAFGEYGNVLHAKEILSALFFQANVPVLTSGELGYSVALADKTTVASAKRALQFYTDFANPIKKVYSWNKSFQRSREAFAANKVGMYAGFVSEVPILPKINPNLNFDIMLWPQSVSKASTHVTYGKFYALAVLNSSPRKARAMEVAALFSTQDFAAPLSSVTLLPSVRRDSLTIDPTYPFSETIIRSAIIAKTWAEPDAKNVDGTFELLINDVVSGKSSYDSALFKATEDLTLMLSFYDNN